MTVTYRSHCNISEGTGIRVSHDPLCPLVSFSLSLSSSLLYPTLKFTSWNEHHECLWLSACSSPVLPLEAAHRLTSSTSFSVAISGSVPHYCYSSPCAVETSKVFSGGMHFVVGALCFGKASVLMGVISQLRLVSGGKTTYLTAAWKNSPPFIRNARHRGHLTLLLQQYSRPLHHLLAFHYTQFQVPRLPNE